MTIPAPVAVPFTAADREAVHAFGRRVRRHRCSVSYFIGLEPLANVPESVGIIRDGGCDAGEEGAAFILWPTSDGAACVLHSFSGHVTVAGSVSGALVEAEATLARPDVGWRASWFTPMRGKTQGLAGGAA